MCGRFELHSAFEIIARLFGLSGNIGMVPTGYNIGRGRDIAIIVKVGGRTSLPSAGGASYLPGQRTLKERV